jgi:two-component system CheB/CheR fusion protein
MLPQVFDLFFQGNRSLDRSHGGLGIGLTLVQRIVELHGGTVDARSDGPGRGSEFIVRLPVLPDPAPKAASFLESAQPSSVRLIPQRRILVVDDHQDSVTMLALLLRSKGYNVATARTGIAALEIATSFCPEVIVLDIGLPEIDGYEVARRLRKIPAMANTFIIALSGYGSEQDRSRAFEAGFNYHLTKPIPTETLFELLSRTLA